MRYYLLRRKRFFHYPLQANGFNALQNYILEGTNKRTNRLETFILLIRQR
jgi:hypothetical protein